MLRIMLHYVVNGNKSLFKGRCDPLRRLSRCLPSVEIVNVINIYSTGNRIKLHNSSENGIKFMWKFRSYLWIHTSLAGKSSHLRNHNECSFNVGHKNGENCVVVRKARARASSNLSCHQFEIIKRFMIKTTLSSPWFRIMSIILWL